MNIKVLVCTSAILVIMVLGTFTHCHAGDQVTDEDYRNYFNDLSIPEQKKHISEVIGDIRSNLPMVIDEYRQWTGIFYMPTLNTILKIFTLNVEYGKVEQPQLTEFKKQNIRNSINSICTGNLYKTWAFEAGVIIRNNFITTTI